MLLVIAAVTLLVDQFTKYLAMTYLAPIEVWAPVPSLAHIFTFTYTTNTGVAFGLFKDWARFSSSSPSSSSRRLSFISARSRKARGSSALALGLQLGGATGNLIDRLRVRPRD